MNRIFYHFTTIDMGDFGKREAKCMMKFGKVLEISVFSEIPGALPKVFHASELTQDAIESIENEYAEAMAIPHVRTEPDDWVPDGAA